MTKISGHYLIYVCYFIISKTKASFFYIEFVVVRGEFFFLTDFCYTFFYRVIRHGFKNTILDEKKHMIIHSRIKMRFKEKLFMISILLNLITTTIQQSYTLR